MKNITRTFSAFLIVLFIALIYSCSKENNSTGGLGGDVNIALTAVDSVTTVYLTVNGVSIPASSEYKVKSNNNGMVTYTGSYDLGLVPDTFINIINGIVTELVSYYHPSYVTWNIDPSKKASFEFTVKITSEGMQNYFVDGKPWTVKYADPLGTVNEVKRDNGDVLKTTVTEKTDVDEWPLGFYYIKTSKHEYNAPASDPKLQKVTFRINHKFGMVYVKTETKDGNVLELKLVPFFLL